MADELLDWEWDFAHMPYGERWRWAHLRNKINNPQKIYHVLHKKTSKNVLPIFSAKKHLDFQSFSKKNGYRSPWSIFRLSSWFHCTHPAVSHVCSSLIRSMFIRLPRYVGSVVLHAAYGYEVKSENDFYIRSVQRAIEPLLHAIHATGSFLVEFMPALKHIPGEYTSYDADSCLKDPSFQHGYQVQASSVTSKLMLKRRGTCETFRSMVSRLQW